MIVGVVFNLGARRVFDYLADDAQIGQRALAPLKNRPTVGLIVSTPARAAVARARLRPILRIYDEPPLPKELLALIQFCADYYHCPPGIAAACALPPGFFRPAPLAAAACCALADDDATKALAAVAPRRAVARRIIHKLAAAGIVAEKELRRIAPNAGRNLRALLNAGIVIRRGPPPTASPSIISQATTSPAADSQATVLPVADLQTAASSAAESPASRPQSHPSPSRPPFTSPPQAGGTDDDSASLAGGSDDDSASLAGGSSYDSASLAGGTEGGPAITGQDEAAARCGDDAIAAADEIAAAFGSYRAFLLEGGRAMRTAAYLRLIAAALARKTAALALFPEVAQAAAFAALCRRRFGDSKIVLQSGALAAGARNRAFCDLLQNGADVAVGTRLAVFAPLPNCGLLIADEEHSESYKQEEGLLYSGRDVAVARARTINAPIALGAAAASVDSFANALRGKYRRIGKPAARPVSVLDVRGEKLFHGLSPRLLGAIRRALADKRQSLILTASSGFAAVLHCRRCADFAVCGECGGRLAVERAANQLLCRRCGRREPLRLDCPTCGGMRVALGAGATRTAAALAMAFPQASVARPDHGAAVYDDAAMGDDEADIIVATRGRFGRRLGVAAFTDIDGALAGADFRAQERLLSQIARIAADADCDIFVQTRLASHPLLAPLASGDWDAARRRLLAERKDAGLPPFSHHALLRARAPTDDAADKLVRAAKRIAGKINIARVFDPLPAPRAHGKARRQLLVESTSRRELRRFLNEWTARLDKEKIPPKSHWTIDVDPIRI